MHIYFQFFSIIIHAGIKKYYFVLTSNWEGKKIMLMFYEINDHC